MGLRCGIEDAETWAALDLAPRTLGRRHLSTYARERRSFGLGRSGAGGALGEITGRLDAGSGLKVESGTTWEDDDDHQKEIPVGDARSLKYPPQRRHPRPLAPPTACDAC